VIVVLLNVYLVILFLLVHFRIVRLNLFWKCSPFIVLLLLLVCLFIPMGWGAPTGAAIVARNSVQIIPDVSGEVIDVPVAPNMALKAGDTLFKIDAVPYESQLKALEAQLKLQQTRLAEVTELQGKGVGRQNDIEQYQAAVDQLQAQIEGAKYNLDKTVVRAPADGYVTNVGLRKGARVTTSPVMAFIDTSETIIGVEINQIDARYIATGQSVEATFKVFPGRILTGKVQAVLQSIASGQTQASGQAVTPGQIQSAPFVVRVALDDANAARQLPAGSTGDAAIYTDHVRSTHIIRKVLLRQVAILNYINPF
jgi:RND family efflux transporter MFP subunit